MSAGAAEMTHDEMAVALRAAGWTCIAPAGTAIPEPQVGQIWIPPNRPEAARTVTNVSAYEVFYDGPDGRSFMLKTSWRQWARKTGATPQ